MISAIIITTPVAASRPRVTRYGTFYAKAYESFKKTFPALLPTAKPLTGALSIEIEFIIPMAKSWTKKKRELNCGKYHTQTPDGDNLAKAVLDCMNGKYFQDDSQIADMRIVKRWGNEGSIYFKIKEIN